MNKLINKFFENATNIFQFFQIITLAFITIHILYWMQNLMEAHWNWLNIFKPVLDLFLNIAGLFSENSVQIFTTVFEIKYGIAMLLYILLFYLLSLCMTITEKIENLYRDMEYSINKAKENKLNLELERQHLQEQLKIRNYTIYISAIFKQGFEVKNINLNEHLTEMNNFIMKNTLVTPQKYGNGFLYSFNDFEKIDNTIELLFKLINSKSPLEYTICIQANDINQPEVNLKIQKLIKLNFVNKITTFADTVWRYKHNQIHKYSISQLGIYLNEDSTNEAYQFIDNKSI